MTPTIGQPFFIVWNEVRSEAFVTDDWEDAVVASQGPDMGGHSALAERFFELHGEDANQPLPIEGIQFPATNGQPAPSEIAEAQS